MNNPFVNGQIHDALGGTARLIVQAIPEMERVVGPQPEIPELPPGEAELRFHRTFARFVRAITAPDHPVVLFLDDLQWTDAASLRLGRTEVRAAGLKKEARARRASRGKAIKD